MNESPNDNRLAWGLLARRQCVLPTWRGWFALLVVAAALGVALLRGIHPFLAVSDPLPGGLLVVEGWASDEAMREVIFESTRNRYDAVVITGGPLERGSSFARFKTYAEFGAATLVQLGMPTNNLYAVPAPAVRQDRTYASALALKRWLKDRGIKPAQINIMTVGVHARRTRMIFATAFRGELKVGIVAIDEQGYEPERWWTSSAGFRVVVDETVAYLYATLFFRPGKPADR